MTKPRILLPFLLGLAGCDALLFRANFEDVEPALLYKAAKLTKAPESISQLKVLNWNIKYGGARLVFFWECEGTRYNMTKAEVRGNLDAVAEFIRQVDPDVLILQEVDRSSTRSVYIDQTQYLLDATDLNYGAYASQHRVDFLPSDGMGHVDFGNAILTRWPITKATRIALPLVEEYPAYYRYLYLKRHILEARIDVPGVDDFRAVNTHLEAFSDDGTKRDQIDQLQEELTRMDKAGALFVASGDLNSLPPGTAKLKDFPDDCPGRFEPDDYSGEEDWLDGLFENFSSAMSLDDVQTDPEAWFSYTGDPDEGWTRTLDYQFTNGTWVEGESYVMQDEDHGGYVTLPLSDHAPVQAVLEVGQ